MNYIPSYLNSVFQVKFNFRVWYQKNPAGTYLIFYTGSTCMRTLIQPFKINQANTVLIGGEQFAFHMSELSLICMGFTQLTLWQCFWFTVGCITGRAEWMVHHFHLLLSNLMWNATHPIWEFHVVEILYLSHSWSVFRWDPNIRFISAFHLLIFMR